MATEARAVVPMGSLAWGEEQESDLGGQNVLGG